MRDREKEWGEVESERVPNLFEKNKVIMQKILLQYNMSSLSGFKIECFSCPENSERPRMRIKQLVIGKFAHFVSIEKLEKQD